MPFIGPRRRAHRPPPILDNGASPVSHRRPVVLVEAAKLAARRTWLARFRQPTIGLVLPDNGGSAVPHRRPLLVGLATAQATARAAWGARFRQPFIPPFPTSNGTDARTAPAVHLAGLDVATPLARRLADVRFRQPFIPPFPTSNGTDARTQPRPIVGLDVARAVAVQRARLSCRPAWSPVVRRAPAAADTSRPFASPLVGFPAATAAPVAARARLRQPTIGLVLPANGTDARTQPRPIVGLKVAIATAAARVLASHRPIWRPAPRRDPASADTSRPGFRPVLVGLPVAAAQPPIRRAALRQPAISPFPTNNGTDARSRPRPQGGGLIGLGEAQRSRLAARAALRQPIRPPRIEDDGSSRRARPGALHGTMQANLVAELRARQWMLRLGVPRRDPATAATTPGVVVTRARLPHAVATRARLVDQVVTRASTR